MSNDERFSQVEAAARRLIEGFFDRISGERLGGGVIATHLAQTFEKLVDEGKAQHTNFYEVHLHPADMDHILDTEPDLSVRLSKWLPELATEVGVVLTVPPEVSLVSDEIIREGRLLIRSEIDPNREDSHTRAHSRKAVEEQMRDMARSRQAWLIVDGKQHIDLDQLTMHIGRRPDNEIVIESSTVSRVHAQIRWRFNQFSLFDMGSRAGVFVNGERIDECSLRPGDVIQLAEISLVYGEGLDGGDDNDTPDDTGPEINPTQRWRRR